jgi:hypothetical protein
LVRKNVKIKEFTYNFNTAKTGDFGAGYTLVKQCRGSWPSLGGKAVVAFEHGAGRRVQWRQAEVACMAQ